MVGYHALPLTFPCVVTAVSVECAAMTPDEARKASERLRLALDMAATGEAMVRARLARERPGADAAEIERLVIEWYGRRPGAECGDGVGRPVDWPRSR